MITISSYHLSPHKPIMVLLTVSPLLYLTSCDLCIYNRKFLRPGFLVQNFWRGPLSISLPNPFPVMRLFVRRGVQEPVHAIARPMVMQTLVPSGTLTDLPGV